jgi:hypothetical protein
MTTPSSAKVLWPPRLDVRARTEDQTIPFSEQIDQMKILSWIRNRV